MIFIGYMNKPVYQSENEVAKLKKELERSRFQLYIFYELTKAMRTTLRLEEITYIILTGLTAHQGLGFNRARPEDVEFVIVPDYPVTVAETVDLQSATHLVHPESIGEAFWILLRGSIGDLIRGESQ